MLASAKPSKPQTISLNQTRISFSRFPDFEKTEQAQVL